MLQRDFKDIRLSLSYSERRQPRVRLQSAGERFNPLDEGREEDEIAIRLIKGLSSYTEYQYENGVNVLTLKIKGNKSPLCYPHSLSAPVKVEIIAKDGFREVRS